MGRSSVRTDWPKRCYTAFNHWELDWYHGHRRYIADPSQPITLPITAFALTERMGGIAIVKILDNIYLQFNRRVGMNEATGHKIDQIVINRDRESLAGLSVGDQYTVTVYGRSIVIRACERIEGGNTVVVSIGYDRHVCTETPRPSHVPTPRPTPAPTSYPTPRPTTLYPTPLPTPWPTLFPSSTPTVAPISLAKTTTTEPTPLPTPDPTSFSPTSVPATAGPTPNPTPEPTLKPTISPTTVPTTSSPTAVDLTEWPTKSRDTYFPTSLGENKDSSYQAEQSQCVATIFGCIDKTWSQ